MQVAVYDKLGALAGFLQFNQIDVQKMGCNS